MNIVIDTYHFLRRMGVYKAYSTLEIVDMVKAQRCAVLKRLHRLEEAKIIESKLNEENQTLYWKVIKLPEKPVSPKMWKESLSLKEMQEIDT